jgi:hypothetical protein
MSTQNYRERAAAIADKHFPARSLEHQTVTNRIAALCSQVERETLERAEQIAEEAMHDMISEATNCIHRREDDEARRLTSQADGALIVLDQLRRATHTEGKP